MVASPACSESFSRCLHLDVLPQFSWANHRTCYLPLQHGPTSWRHELKLDPWELSSALPFASNSRSSRTTDVASPTSLELQHPLFSAVSAITWPGAPIFSHLNYCNRVQTGPSATFLNSCHRKASQSEPSTHSHPRTVNYYTKVKSFHLLTTSLPRLHFCPSNLFRLLRWLWTSLNWISFAYMYVFAVLEHFMWLTSDALSDSPDQRFRKILTVQRVIK